jgi:multiple sugar transport system permease protein
VSARGVGSRFVGSRFVGSLVLHVALAVLALVAMTPLLWMVSASFMPTGEATAVPLRWLPSAPTLEHYRTLFARMDLGRQVMNSVIVASATTVLAVLVNGAAGYAFAKLRFRGRDRLLWLMLLALVVPGQIGMLPLFLLVRSLGLVNSLAGVVIPGLASIFGIFLVRQYALSIPDSILDAARVDGAGELGVFRRVALPLIAPILATLAVFTFLGAWNDFLWPLVVLADETRYTLPVGLASLAGEHVQDTELMMAGAVVTVAPAMLLFVALQRYYLAGIMGGGVKE